MTATVQARADAYDALARVDVADPPRLGQTQRRRVQPPATPWHLVQPSCRPLA
jgi:hypothetical protein